MNWVIVKEEHHRGSADPYVARTTIQAGYLSSYFQLGEEKEQGVVGVLDQYRRHLHQCDEISQRIISEITEHSETLKATLLNRRTGEPIRLPSVRNLTNDIENFLYHAKLAFRELKDLFKYTQGKDFKGTTQYSHIADWSEKKFGDDNLLSNWLRSNCDWIQKLIDSRNAVEHPEKASLVIKNFHVRENGNIEDPLWALNGEEPKLVLSDMKVIPSSMLQYAEILLIYALNNIRSIYPFVIAEIPQDKRKKANPMRFMVTLEQDLDENGMYKYDWN